MGTIKTLIEDSLREIVVLQEGEQASADMIVDGLYKLRSMLNTWSVEGLMVPYQTTETFVLDITQSFATWQPGGDWNSTTPVDVVNMSFQLQTLQDPLDRMDRRQYMALPNTAIVSQPRFFLFERSAAGATVYFDCTPYGGSMKVASKKAFDTTFELTDQTEFPAEYDELLRTHLAWRFCPAYGKTLSNELVELMRMSKKVVRRLNAEPVPTMRPNIPSRSQGRLSLPYRTS